MNAGDNKNNNEKLRGASHLITLSALASTFGGIVRPICLAVLRLIASSNFVGCSIGISPGFAPFRILSTYVAARRYNSVTFTPYVISPPSTYVDKIQKGANPG